MSIAIVYEYPETDEMGIRLIAKEMGVSLVYIPFRKVTVSLDKEGYRLRSKSKDVPLKEISAVINRTQSKNRRLYAANVLEAFDKHVINSSRVEYLCFSKLRTLLQFWKRGVRIPKTIFIPCDSFDLRRDGGRIHNEEVIADLMQKELGNGNIVVKPDAGTHGMMVRLAKDRKELIKFLRDTEPSIINPIGFVAQEMIDKWFYDLRIITYKEKGKTPNCFPTGLARAGFKDFRTNTYLGNMVFGVDLPISLKEAAIKCGEAIGNDDEAWVLALDAMPNVREDKIVENHYIGSNLEKLTPDFDVVNKIKCDEALKYKNFARWNKRLEEAYGNYRSSEAYERIKNVIEDSVERKRDDVYFHEANACPEFWEQTRIIADANVAVILLKCAQSISDPK